MQIDKCTGRRGPDRPSLKSRWLDPSIRGSHQLIYSQDLGGAFIIMSIMYKDILYDTWLYG